MNSVEKYEVTGSEIMLGEIAIRLYGRVWMWPKMARWNALAPPYHLEIGQWLDLLEAPTISRAEGDLRLLEMWRKQLNRREQLLAIPRHKLSPRDRKMLDAIEAERRAGEVKLASEIKIRKQVEIKMQEEQEAARKRQIASIQRDRAIEGEKTEVEEALEDPVSPESLFAQGQELFEKGEQAGALDRFHRSRKSDSDPLPPWFYEIRVLRLMKRVDEAKAVGRELIEAHPEVKDLPMLQFLEEDS